MARAPVKNNVLSYLRERGVPVGTVLDVGVLTGTPELIKAFPDVRHVLFEPVAEFAATIRQVYQDVDHELANVAVSDADGIIGLKTFSILEGTDISHSQMTDDLDGESVRTIPMVRLDTYLKRSPQEAPYLLKLDVDGAEMEILAGAVETLKQSSVVIIEVPRHHIVQRLQALEKAGFTLFDLVEPCYYDGALWQCDAVFLRNDILAKHFEPLSNVNFKAELYELYRG